MRIIRKLKLFFRIVWREWEEGYRLSIATAWDVSNTVHGKKEKIEIGMYENFKENIINAPEPSDL